MPTLVSTARSEPLAMPLMSSDPATSYNELIRQLAAQAPKPYGAIPPLLKKRKKKNKHHRSPPNTDDDTADGHNDKARIRRRMSHVENWVVVDSKESLPDEEELVNAFSTFLSADFFTQVLPLHMPPPSLSDPNTSAAGPIPVQSLHNAANDNGDYEEEEEEDDDDDDDEDEAYVLQDHLCMKMVKMKVKQKALLLYVDIQSRHIPSPKHHLHQQVLRVLSQHLHQKMTMTCDGSRQLPS